MPSIPNTAQNTSNTGIAQIMSFLAIPGSDLASIEGVIRNTANIAEALGFNTTSEVVETLFGGLFDIASDWPFLADIVAKANSYIAEHFGGTIRKILNTRDMILKLYNDVQKAKAIYENLKKIHNIKTKVGKQIVIKELTDLGLGKDNVTIKALSMLLNTISEGGEVNIEQLSKELLESLKNTMFELTVRDLSNNMTISEKNVKITLYNNAKGYDFANGYLKISGSEGGQVITGYLDKNGITLNIKHNLVNLTDTGAIITQIKEKLAGLGQTVYKSYNEFISSISSVKSKITGGKGEENNGAKTMGNIIKNFPLILAGMENMSVTIKFFITTKDSSIDTINEIKNMFANSVPEGFTLSGYSTFWIYPVMMDVTLYERITLKSFMLESIEVGIAPPFTSSANKIFPSVVPVTITGKSPVILDRKNIEALFGFYSNNSGNSKNSNNKNGGSSW